MPDSAHVVVRPPRPRRRRRFALAAVVSVSLHRPSLPASLAGSSPCAHTDRRVHERLDAELPADEAEALLEHLAACPPCRAQADRLQRFREALHRLRGRLDAAPATLRARVDALLETVAPRDGAAPADAPHHAHGAPTAAGDVPHGANRASR